MSVFPFDSLLDDHEQNVSEDEEFEIIPVSNYIILCWVLLIYRQNVRFSHNFHSHNTAPQDLPKRFVGDSLAMENNNIMDMGWVISKDDNKEILYLFLNHQAVL